MEPPAPATLADYAVAPETLRHCPHASDGRALQQLWRAGWGAKTANTHAR